MSSDNNQMGTPKAMRNVFGIIMIVIYLGMGVLFFVGFFKPIYGTWEWLRWVGGGIFIAYGIWRAYRQFAGIDDPSSRN